MNYSSRLVEEAVDQFASLPGIGKRTALRLVLHLLKQDNKYAEKFGQTFIRLRNEVKYCKKCHNIADVDLCEICTSSKRNQSIVCVVEDVRDVMAIENTGQFQGIYHVLGGIISPMDGIGPADLNIESLVKKAADLEIKEVVLALSTTMEGDTTNFYLFKRLNQYPVNISQIARGIAFGDEIEYADEFTLGRSIQNRVPYETGLAIK